MPAKKRTIIDSAQGHTVIEESVDPKDQPSVLAYRVGALEMAVKEGFVGQSKKIDDLIIGFVTHKELTDYKAQASEEHQAIWTAIKDFKSSIKWWVATIIAITTAVAIAVPSILDLMRLH